MTKSQLITQLAQRLKLSRKDAESAVDAVFDAIAGSLESGRRVELRGFCSFGLKECQAREGRNPKTGETVQVEAKRVLFFKASKALRARVDIHETLDHPPTLP